MTDRASPGAQGSTVRNIERGEASDALSNGFILESSEPSNSAKRWQDLDEAQFNEFAETHNATNLTITVDPGEAYIDGWLATDEQKTTDVDTFVTDHEIRLGWDPDAVYNDSIHGSREEADRVIVETEAEWPDNTPYIVLYEVTTDGDGITSVTDTRPYTPEIDELKSGDIDVDELSSKKLPVIDVTWFGADPTGQEDSVPAFLEAIDFAESLDGGTIFVPSGRFRVDTRDNKGSPIPLHLSDVTLAGTGRNSSIIESYSRTFNGETYTDDDLRGGVISVYGQNNNNRLKNVEIRDLGVHVIEEAPGSQVVCNFVEDSKVTNVMVDNRTYYTGDKPTGVPIWWGRNESRIDNSHLSVDNCFVINQSDGNPGIEMAGTTDGIVSNCHVRAEGAEHGIKVEWCDNGNVSNCNVHSDDNGITNLKSKQTTIEGCNVFCGQEGIRLAGNEERPNDNVQVADLYLEYTFDDGSGTAINCFSNTGSYTLDNIRAVNFSTGIWHGIEISMKVSDSYFDVNGWGIDSQDFGDVTDLSITETDFVTPDGLRIYNATGNKSFQMKGGSVTGVNSGQYHIQMLEDSNSNAPTKFRIEGVNLGDGDGDGVFVADTATRFFAKDNFGSITFDGDDTVSSIVIENNI